MGRVKPGYIYVLTHPSRSGTYKVGVTMQTVKKRLSQHNTDYAKLAGQIVKETGQKWELHSWYSVDDIYHAENEFWSSTGIGHVPFRQGIEIAPMTEEQLNDGLRAARNAGTRNSPQRVEGNGRRVITMSLAEYNEKYGAGSKEQPKKKLVHNREWMAGVLEGSGMTHVGEKFNHIQYTEFECANGHVFSAIPRSLALNVKCPKCTH